MLKKELIVSALIAIAFLIAKFLLPKPIQFSRTVSVIIIILLALLFFFIFILTVKGKYIGRRVVFLLVGIALLLPFFMQFTLPLQISPEVRGAYDGLASLKGGSKVLASFDYDPASAPELQPMAEAFFKYCFDNDIKVIVMGLWPQGAQQANLAVEAAMEETPRYRDEIQYGEDWVNLGFQAGNEFVIVRMGESFKAMFPRDIVKNLPYDSIPVLKNVRNFSNIDYSINFSAGKPGTVEWVQVAVDRYNLNMAAGNTAVQAPMAYPYLKAKQLTGLMGGMSGGAEFEKITGKFGKATTYLLSQSFAHMVVIVLILIGNFAFFRERMRDK